MTVREQVNIWTAVSDQLKQESGRSQGRPSSKTTPIGQGFLSPDEIAQIATTKAGFPSIKTAERAVAVFTRGAAALQAKVLNGKLSISAAYKETPKPARRAKIALPAVIQAQVIRALPVAEPCASNVEPSADDHPVQPRLLTSGVQEADAPAHSVLPSGEHETLADEVESPRLEGTGRGQGVDATRGEPFQPANEPEPAAAPQATAEDPVPGDEGAATGAARVPVEPGEVERAFDRACASLVELIEHDPEAVRGIARRVGRGLRKIEKILP